MATLNGILTLIALLTFIGIVWWAFAKFRVKDNEEASMLPFAQPDEILDQHPDNEQPDQQGSGQQDKNLGERDE